MKKVTLFSVLIAATFIAGCGGGGIHGDVYVDDSDRYTHYPPELGEFHIVDSDGFSTEDFDAPESALDPYVDDGIFDIYWDVLADNNYVIEYRINSLPMLGGSRLIDAEVCGVGLSCDYDGYQFCQYNPDFSMSCDVSNHAYPDIDSVFNPVDLDDMILTVPQIMYFIVQICDTETTYCEYDYKPVTLF